MFVQLKGNRELKRGMLLETRKLPEASGILEVGVVLDMVLGLTKLPKPTDGLALVALLKLVVVLELKVKLLLELATSLNPVEKSDALRLSGCWLPLEGMAA